MEGIGERISVVVSFGPELRIRPLRFRWSGRAHEVKEVTYTWATMEGQSTVHHFAVSDGVNLYELSFDNHSLIWRLEGTDPAPGPF